MAKLPVILPKAEAQRFEGYTGTEYYSGYFSEEENQEWRDERRVQIVEEMRSTDGAVQGVLTAVKTPILGAKLEITPYSNDPKDIEICEEVKYQLKNMPYRTFDEFLREACTYFDFGHSVFEKIWGIRKDGKIYLKDLAPRTQSSILQWQTIDKQAGITQRKRSDMIYEPDEANNKDKTEFSIPLRKLLIFTNDKEGDDLTGRSVLRSAYKHYKYKSGIYRVSAVGIEKTAVGVPTGILPEGVTPDSEAYQSFEEALQNVRANEKTYMLLPYGYDFKFTTSSGGSLGTAVKDMIDHHDRMITMCVLAEFLMLGQNSTGSYALSQDKSNFFLMHVEQKANYIANQIVRYVIKDIVDYNYTGVEGYPSAQFTSFGRVDMKVLSEVFKVLIETGIVNIMNEAERSHARSMFNLPEIEQEDDVVEDDEPEEEPEEKSSAEKDEGGDDTDDDLHQLSQKKKPTFYRELTEPEEKVDFVYLEKNFDRLEKELRDGLADIVGAAIKKAEPQFQRIIKGQNIVDLPNINVVPQSQVKNLLKKVIKDAYEVGKKTASEELDIERPSTPIQDTQTIAFDAAELAAQMKAEIENRAKQTAKDSIAKEVAAAAAVSAVMGAMANSAAGMIGNLSGFTIGENINRGRFSVFNKNLSEISGFLRTEILDGKTCNMCLSLDQRIVKADDPMAKLGAVHNNCRGEWIALRTSDFEKQKDVIAKGVLGIPKSVMNNFETVGGVPVINSFTQLKKPVNRSNEGVQKVIKEK